MDIFIQRAIFALMIELAQHIESLLLENDCVIVPELGGFIAHYSPAKWDEKENLFLPPVRTLGFNPNLTLNDGLLVQSYMNTYNTHFPDATRKVQQTVESLCKQLYEEGKVELVNIGEIRFTMQQTYEFTPFDHKLATPRLYGLDTFEIKELAALQQPAHLTKAPRKMVVAPPAKKEYRVNYAYWSYAAVAVAIIALIFGISTPAGNTYIERNNYAQLLPMDLLEKIEKQSVVFTPVAVHTVQDKRKTAASSQNSSKASPQQRTIVTREVSVPKASASNDASASAEQPAKTSQASDNASQKDKAPQAEKSSASQVQTATNSKYHLIVAGGVMQKNAEILVTQLKERGYSSACVLSGNGIIRVSILSYSTESEALKELMKLRKQEEFQTAWLLANK